MWHPVGVRWGVVSFKGTPCVCVCQDYISVCQIKKHFLLFDTTPAGGRGMPWTHTPVIRVYAYDARTRHKSYIGAFAIACMQTEVHYWHVVHAVDVNANTYELWLIRSRLVDFRTARSVSRDDSGLFTVCVCLRGGSQLCCCSMYFWKRPDLPRDGRHVDTDWITV